MILLPSRLREGLGVGLRSPILDTACGGPGSHPRPLPQAGGE